MSSTGKASPDTGSSRTGRLDSASGSSSTNTPAAAGDARRARLVVIGLVVLVVLATVPVGWLGWRAVRAQDAEDDVAAAVAAARTGMTAVLSYDSATLDADLARARPLVTGAFAEQFEKTAHDSIVPASRERTFTVGADVTRSAVVSAQPDQVDVLLFLDQTARSSTQPDPQHEKLQLVLTMTRDADGRWLISNMQAL